MRSEFTIATIQSYTCAAERRDAGAMSPNAKKTMCLSQCGAIVMNGRIVIMDRGLALCREGQSVGETRRIVHELHRT